MFITIEDEEENTKVVIRENIGENEEDIVINIEDKEDE